MSYDDSTGGKSSESGTDRRDFDVVCCLLECSRKIRADSSTSFATDFEFERDSSRCRWSQTKSRSRRRSRRSRVQRAPVQYLPSRIRIFVEPELCNESFCRRSIPSSVSRFGRNDFIRTRRCGFDGDRRSLRSLDFREGGRNGSDGWRRFCGGPRYLLSVSEKRVASHCRRHAVSSHACRRRHSNRRSAALVRSIELSRHRTEAQLRM